MMTTPTTLQLARRIATAVLAASRDRHRDSTQDGPTQAVLRALRRDRMWFMRIDRDGRGQAVETRLARRRQKGR